MLQEMLDLTGFLTRASVVSATFQNLHSQPECLWCKMCSSDLFCIVYLAYTRLLLQRKAANTTLPLPKSRLSLLPMLICPVLCWHRLDTNLVALVPWPWHCIIYISADAPCMWLRALWRLFSFCFPFWPDLCLHTPISRVPGQVFSRFRVFLFTNIFHL